MTHSFLLQHLVFASAQRTPEQVALAFGDDSLNYAVLAQQVQSFAAGIGNLGLQRGDRVGIWLDKRFETVIATFGAAAAGCVFVPLNPLLKPEQVGYILRDCNVRLLVTSAERMALIAPVVAECPDLLHLAITGSADGVEGAGIALHPWDSLVATTRGITHRVIDTDMLSILYTSGSTGRPKGVVLSHRNMVAGAASVAAYLENGPQDTILAALPLSFDAGFSQLTTAFHAGARAVLINYLLPKDVLNAVVKERVTGLTAVPPLWIQLSQLKWPASVTEHLRYIANTGGRMPEETLRILRTHLPKTRPFLMYGLTEAFRSTYLPPEEASRRPDSIGKAIPNAEILVLRDDGTPCAPDEPGELVHRGALVRLGFWNDRHATPERHKPLPGRAEGLVMPEIAVFSGDTVRMDAEGFLYFVGRRDEMIKTSGYRVSPTEIEEVLYSTQQVGECAAFGIEHAVLGQAIVVVATPHPGGSLDEAALLAQCRDRLPMFMVPARIHARNGSLPRNPNGKIDRKAIAAEFDSAPGTRSP